MKMSSFRYIGPQAWKSMISNGLMTVASILTITISLFLCSAFMLLLTNLDRNISQVEEDMTVIAYLDGTVQLDEDFERVENELSALPNVEKVEFISKEHGLTALQNRFGDLDLMETLEGSNPLPDSYAITAAGSESLSEIAAGAEEVAGVQMVRYAADTVERLMRFSETMHVVGIAIMLMLAAAAVVLISLSIRLAIMARKKEIQVMKWVGATNAFIRWPFFLEGLCLGTFSALLALILVILLYSRAVVYLNTMVSFLTVIPLSQIWPILTLFTLGAGVVLGALGASLQLTRLLKV